MALGRRMAAHRDHPLVRGAARLGKLGDQEPLYVAAAGLGLAGPLARQPRLLRLGAEVFLAVAFADAAKSALKHAVRRSRPHVLLDEGCYEANLQGSERKEVRSLPSGHMAGGMAAASAVRRAWPGSAPYGLALCGLLGWSRISKGAHWPLDVAAGAAASLAAGAAASARVLRLALRGLGGAEPADRTASAAVGHPAVSTGPAAAGPCPWGATTSCAYAREA